MAVDIPLLGILESFLCIPALIIGVLIIAGIRIVNQWEVGLQFRLGRFIKTLHPGLRIIIPFIDSVIKVDTRIQTVDIPKQEVITRDNVSVMINGVVYFKVEDPEKAVIKIRNYRYAVAQYSQTALRDVIGEAELDYLLTNREQVAEKIKAIVDRETSEWGIDIASIKIQDIELPPDMKRAMARQAEAEREKRATIIKSEGEVVAAQNLTKAAKLLASSPASIHLRTLQTINDISPDQSNTIVFALPVEILEAFKAFASSQEKKDKAKTKKVA